MSADVAIICIRLNDYAQVATVASILFALLFQCIHLFSGSLFFLLKQCNYHTDVFEFNYLFFYLPECDSSRGTQTATIKSAKTQIEWFLYLQKNVFFSAKLLNDTITMMMANLIATVRQYALLKNTQFILDAICEY